MKKQQNILIFLVFMSLSLFAEGVLHLEDRNHEYETSTEQSDDSVHATAHSTVDYHKGTSDEETVPDAPSPLRFLPEDQHNCVKAVTNMLNLITSPVHRSWTAVTFCQKCPVPKLCKQHLIDNGVNLVRHELSLKKVPKSYFTFDPYSNKYWGREDM